MINHLKANYYKIARDDLKLDTARMNAPHNINDSFESIIEQIETAIDFANAVKVPYTLENVMTTDYDLIFVTGYFTNTCRQWNQKPEADKTCADFKSYFSEEH